MSAVIPPEFQPFVIAGNASGRFRSEEEIQKVSFLTLKSIKETPLVPTRIRHLIGMPTTRSTFTTTAISGCSGCSTRLKRP